jgi:hypothetical protein
MSKGGDVRMIGRISQREGSNLRPADYERTALAFYDTDNKGNYSAHNIDCAQILLTRGAICFRLEFGLALHAA